MARHVTEIRVRWGDVDSAGIIFYPQIFRWFDIAADELFRTLGLAWARLFPDAGLVGLPILEAHCRFRSPIRYDDQVRIETVVEEVRDKTIRLGYRVFGPAGAAESGTLCAEGYEVRGWVERRDGRLQARSIPDGVRARLGA